MTLTKAQREVLRKMAMSLGPWAGHKSLKGLERRGLVRIVDDTHPLGPFYLLTDAGRRAAQEGK